VGSLLPIPAGLSAAPVLAAVTLLALGHLAANPTALALVPRFAQGGATGSYFGLLATLGGIAVLLGNLAAGRLLDGAGQGPAALPWLLLAAVPSLAAALCPRLVNETGARAARDPARQGGVVS
jgi:MFS family permease